MEESSRLRDVIRRAFGYSLLFIGVLGCAGGWFITRRVLKRIDDMTETTRTIMAGDLDGRLKVAGTGDELDRLAQNLNADARPHRRTDARHAARFPTTSPTISRRP